ncbi:unnamed protein product [Rhodiola kirilowii]
MFALLEIAASTSIPKVFSSPPLKSGAYLLLFISVTVVLQEHFTCFGIKETEHSDLQFI